MDVTEALGGGQGDRGTGGGGTGQTAWTGEGRRDGEDDEDAVPRCRPSRVRTAGTAWGRWQADGAVTHPRWWRTCAWAPCRSPACRARGSKTPGSPGTPRTRAGPWCAGCPAGGLGTATVTTRLPWPPPPTGETGLRHDAGVGRSPAVPAVTCAVDLGGQHGGAEHLVLVLLVDGLALPQVRRELGGVDGATQQVPVTLHVLPQRVLLVPQRPHVLVHPRPCGAQARPLQGPPRPRGRRRRAEVTLRLCLRKGTGTRGVSLCAKRQKRRPRAL